MTLKEIAKLAEVSPSTVSKILHNKDEHIRKETRERVLDIVAQHQYVPYATSSATFSLPTKLLGVMFSDSTAKLILSQQLSITARENGYTLLFCPFSNEEEEKRCLELFKAHKVDGYLRERLPSKTYDIETTLSIPSVSFCIGQNPDPDCFCVDYRKLGYISTKKLVDMRHQQILCITEQMFITDEFIEGFKQCLSENQIPFYSNMVRFWSPEMLWSDFEIHRYTAAVCSSALLASQMLQFVQRHDLKVPTDFSICCIQHHHTTLYTTPVIHSVEIPLQQMGSKLCEQLIDKVNKKTSPPILLEYPEVVGKSIDIPRTLRDKKILVIGSVHTDTLLTVKKLPIGGEVTVVEKRLRLPGGKGLNQTLGASKLGADAYLISKIGQDYDGSTLYNFMMENNINTDGVLTDNISSTGHAYIAVQDDGESSITVYHGANQNLTAEDISRYEKLFENTALCLLQTEIPLETTLFAGKLAKKHSVVTVLKPCGVSSLSEELLKYIDILVPNEQEAQLLTPNLYTPEQQAEFFRSKGVATVIITLSDRGCYLQTEDKSAYFPAATFIATDTTGAADAFIATLGVYLSRGCSIEDAITYANYAAGYSITRQGVPPSLIDRAQLEFYVGEPKKVSN